MTIVSNHVIIRNFELVDYQAIWQAMQQFTNQRDETTVDEIWCTEHPAVFTQGQNGKPEHIIDPGNIPVIHADRGGQVTYHGPGQLMVYTLVDLKRKKLNVREMVTILEQSVIQLLADYQIEAKAKCEAPGVYVDNKKICSVGLRIRRGCSYHGLALNVAMDLSPFSRINPCGFKQLEMTMLALLEPTANIHTVRARLADHLISNLGYTSRSGPL